jgi:hypothetical protein
VIPLRLVVDDACWVPVPAPDVVVIFDDGVVGTVFPFVLLVQLGNDAILLAVNVPSVL